MLKTALISIALLIVVYAIYKKSRTEELVLVCPKCKTKNYGDYLETNPPKKFCVGCMEFFVKKEKIKVIYPGIHLETEDGKIIIELSDETPKMRDNFIKLCSGEIKKIVGTMLIYKGDYIIGGDFTKGDGTGGRALVEHSDEESMLKRTSKTINMLDNVFTIGGLGRPFGRIIRGHKLLKRDLMILDCNIIE